MGWYDNLTGKDYESMSDHDVGMDALEHFHKIAVIEAQAKGHLVFSFEKMVEMISSVRGGTSQINGLGLGIKLIDFGEGDVKDSMETLAKTTEGRIPKNIAVFREALMNEATVYANKIGGFLEDNPIGQTLVKTAAVTQWTIDTGASLGKELVESTVDILKWRKPLLVTGGILAAGVGIYLLVTRAQDIAEMAGSLGKELKRAKK